MLGLIQTTYSHPPDQLRHSVIVNLTRTLHGDLIVTVGKTTSPLAPFTRPFDTSTLAVSITHAPIATTSSFGGKGKKTAWSTWKVFPEMTATFEDLLLMQHTVSSLIMSTLEWFVILMYDRISDLTDISEARKQLFT